MRPLRVPEPEPLTPLDYGHWSKQFCWQANIRRGCDTFNNCCKWSKYYRVSHIFTKKNRLTNQLYILLHLRDWFSIILVFWDYVKIQIYTSSLNEKSTRSSSSSMRTWYVSKHIISMCFKTWKCWNSALFIASVSHVRKTSPLNSSALRKHTIQLTELCRRSL